MNEHAAPPSAAKSRRYRDRKRAAGLREVRLWLPDVRSPEFRALALRDAALIAAAVATPEEAEWQEFAEAQFAGIGEWTDPDDAAR